MKSGVFRPTCRVLRYSQVSGALRRKFGTSDLHAAGYLTEDGEHNQAEYLIYAPRDRATEISKIPLEIEVLRQVQGKVFVVQNETAKSLPEAFDLTLGGALSWGLGVCQLTKKGIVDDKDTVYEPDKEGLVLATRLPLKRYPLTLPSPTRGEGEPLTLPSPTRGEGEPLTLPSPARGEGEPLTLPSPARGEGEIDVLKEFGIREVLRPIYGYLFEPEGIAGGKYVLALFEGSVVQGPRCLLRKA
jgi:hypothetical protein